MKIVFFNETKVVQVSRFTQDGWWIRNELEHVAKGTALSPNCTLKLYEPSRKGMIACYDLEKEIWLDEIEDMTWKAFWNEAGQRFVIGDPDGGYSEWAIKEEPPEYNKKTHTVLHSKETGWKVFEIYIGRFFYDEWGNEFIVSDYNFELPENHTWEAPPKLEKGYAVKLVDGQWLHLIDNRGKKAYSKDRDSEEMNDYQVEELGELPDTYTLLAYKAFDSWVNDETGWQYDKERHLPFKTEEEKSWRNTELTNVINRIDQYEKDQNYPVELRTSPIETEEQFLQLLQDRKQLSDFPETDDFPFGERPPLSSLAN
ncbi:hypothetical protein AB6D75_19365 [Vibrio splendidus]